PRRSVQSAQSVVNPNETMNLKGRDFLNTADFTLDELTSLIDLAATIKAGDHRERPLQGRSVALVFFNPSLRTRASMEIAVYELGSSRHHPFQALADAMTIREKLGTFEHQRVVRSWAYHPKPLPMAVPNSFALIAAQLGLDLTIACPTEYDLGDEVMAEIEA